MRRLLIANRGEIACRVMRTAQAMGIQSVAVFSEPDADAPHVRAADVAVPIGGQTATESYLDVRKLLEAAQRAGADAVHPGYGFVSENAEFARACIDAGLIWVGPPPAAMQAMADKITARQVAEQAGVPVLPGAELLGDDVSTWRAAADQIGLPLLVKASAGGGGRGMRTVFALDDLAEAIVSARREASAAFGDPTVFLERWLVAPRHVEVQVVGDSHGNLVHLFERECSIQRRHQKLIEEAPAPRLAEATRRALYEAALRLARAIGYCNAGTVEFLVDRDEALWFLEMNTRLQVEHPVTEAITSLDLVRLQIEVARGERLSVAQSDVVCRGHAIEARLYAEDPAQDFLPSAGPLRRFEAHGVTTVRWDSGVVSGSAVNSFYDALLAKAVSHAATRDEAVARLGRALRQVQVHGVSTNRDCLVAVLESASFSAAETGTDFLSQHRDVLQAGPPPEVVRLHALAAALVARQRRRMGAGALGFVPGGWRNLPSTPQRATFRASGEAIEVRYDVESDGRVQACVDGYAMAGRMYDTQRTSIDLEVDGLRSRFDVFSYIDADYVNSFDWQTRLEPLPRFPLAAVDAGAHGPSAPLPGTVVAVTVQPGDRVQAGQTLVVLDAMKIEHRVLANTDATVAEVRVSAGQRVDAHQVLVLLEPL